MKVAIIAANIAALGALLPAGPARADTCQWLSDPAVATRAARELTSHPEVVAFCEPCGDLAPSAPRTVKHAVVQRIDDAAVSLVVDGVGVDLAYLYVKTSERQYRNLAVLAGCPTSGVSPSLRVDVATSAGVLIRAEHAAPEAAPASDPRAAVVPADLVLPAPSTVVVVSSGPSLWVILLLGCGAPLAILASLALWLAARRRELHVPRASRLAPPP